MLCKVLRRLLNISVLWKRMAVKFLSRVFRISTPDFHRESSGACAECKLQNRRQCAKTVASTAICTIWGFANNLSCDEWDREHEMRVWQNSCCSYDANRASDSHQVSVRLVCTGNILDRDEISSKQTIDNMSLSVGCWNKKKKKVFAFEPLTALFFGWFIMRSNVK